MKRHESVLSLGTLKWLFISLVLYYLRLANFLMHFYALQVRIQLD